MKLTEQQGFMVGETSSKNSAGKTLKFRIPVALFNAHLRRAYEECVMYHYSAAEVVQRLEEVYEANEWIGAYPAELEPPEVYQGGDAFLDLFYKPGDELK